MAKKKKAAPFSIDARARSLVNISYPEAAEAVTYTLPVNEGFEDETINRSGGVDYPLAREIAIAEAAIADVFNNEIGPLRTWIRWAASVLRGGLPALAAALLDIPLHSETRASKEYKAELRKLEEYRQGKYKSASGARRQRMLDLNAKLLRDGQISLKVLGDWEVESGRGGRPRVYSFKWWTADDDSADNIDLLDAGGAGFCEQVRGHYEQFTRSLVTLTHVYALQIERIAEA